MLANCYARFQFRRLPRFCVFSSAVTLMCVCLISLFRFDSAQADDAEPTLTACQVDGTKLEKQHGEPKSDKPEMLRYGGLVADSETEKGISNATVVVRRFNRTFEEETFVDETRHTTTEDGKYSFDIPPEQASIPGLYIELDIEHEGYVGLRRLGVFLSTIRQFDNRYGRGRYSGIEKVWLPPSDPITGTVLTPDGKPIGGIRVVGYSQSSNIFRSKISYSDSVTDVNGKFRLSLVKGGTGFFFVWPASYAFTSRSVNPQRGDVGEIRLRAGVRVSGRALSVSGKPAANIPINIRYEKGDIETVNTLNIANAFCRSAMTDNNGDFEFAPLPTGDYRLLVNGERYDSKDYPWKQYDIGGVYKPTDVKVREGTVSAPIELHASPHVMFHAQNYDSEGARIRGHEVVMRGQVWGDSWVGVGRPNAEGAIAIPVPKGLEQTQIQLWSDEAAALRFRRHRGMELQKHTPQFEWIEFGTLNEDVKGFDVIRYTAPVVLVDALDSDHRKIKDFTVSATYLSGKQSNLHSEDARWVLKCERQKDGRYRTFHLVPDQEATFTITARNYISEVVTLKLSESEVKNLVVILKRAAR